MRFTMNKETLQLWLWPLLALMTAHGSMAAVDTYLESTSPEMLARWEAAGVLRASLARQRDFYRNTHAYAVTLRDLELDLNSHRWQYELLSGRIQERLMVLVEASDQGQRMAIDLAGDLYRSDLKALPSVAPWLPVPAVGRGRKAR